MATHISRHLYSVGNRVACVCSRGMESAQVLATELDCGAVDDPALVPTNADFYLLAVPDRFIPEVAARLPKVEGMVLHCAGAVAMGVLGSHAEAHGVLYPLQTLSRDRQVSLGEVPFLLEASDPKAMEKLRLLASGLSGRIVEVDSDERAMIHLAAVFANNFSNHMVDIAARIMEEHQLDFALLEPILKETFAKMNELGPRAAQTGPARRGDKESMQKHLDLLKEHPEWQKLYTFVSHNISDG